MVDWSVSYFGQLILQQLIFTTANITRNALFCNFTRELDLKIKYVAIPENALVLDLKITAYGVDLRFLSTDSG